MTDFRNPQIDFDITSHGTLIEAQENGKTVFKADFDGKELSFSILYDFTETPLALHSGALFGDSVRIKIFHCRIELYVNGVLCDEEWPYGNNYLKSAEISACRVSPVFSEAVFTPVKDIPSVTHTFNDIELWQPSQGVFIGDCMPYYEDGVFHVIYLYDRHHHGSKWGKGAHQWAHVSTEDFVTWHAHPMAVEITEGHEGSICTGSHIKKNGVHYLFYTVRTMDSSPAPICRSISFDGYHYEKDKSFGFKLSEKYTSASARDPKVILGEDGLYHMLITTGLAQSGNGCLAHLVSDELDSWRELDEPVYVAPDDNQPECPDYFKLGDYYYLVFSHRSVGEYLYSKKPFCDWKAPKEPKIPCSSVPKGAVVGNKVIFAGYKGNGKYAGTMVFKSAVQGEDGELIFLT